MQAVIIGTNGGCKMDNFENVSVVKRANVYFEGKVTSRTILFSNGEKKTLGIIMPGQYEFGTNEKEQMELLTGKLEVLLPGNEKWITVNPGQTFEIPAKSEFKVKAAELSDYCCSYMKE
jgi:purine/pyrimidine-nucleoside phosphorylase